MSGPVRFRNLVKVSERHGAGEWLTERLALLALVPLGLWLAVSAYSLAGTDYGTAMAWFARPVNAALSAVTAILFCVFSSLAWKVIVEDYIHKPGTRALLLGLVKLVFMALAAASVFLIVRLATGSAPLPAGFGV